MLFCEECGNMLLKHKKTSKKIYKGEFGVIVIECECGCKNIRTIQELEQMGIMLPDSSLLKEDDGSDSAFCFYM